MSSYDAERRFILRRIPTSTLHKQRNTRATRKSPKKCADNLGAPRAPTKEQQRIPPEQVKQKEREPLDIFCCTCTFHPLIASDNAQIYRSYRHNHALNGKNRRPHDFLWFWRVPIPRGWPRFLIGKFIKIFAFLPRLVFASVDIFFDSLFTSSYDKAPSRSSILKFQKKSNKK